MYNSGIEHAKHEFRLILQAMPKRPFKLRDHLVLSLWPEWRGSAERFLLPSIRLYRYRWTTIFRVSFWLWTLDIGWCGDK